MNAITSAVAGLIDQRPIDFTGKGCCIPASACFLFNNVKGVFLKTIALLVTAIGIVFSVQAQADEQLMEKNGCISCHRIDQKQVGPAFKDIAAKYKTRSDAENYLFDKVRNGSEDGWGDLPMPPKSVDQLSDENLRIIIDWLLTL